MTIHNMAFQGYYPREVFRELGLPRAAWSMTGVEYHGGVGFLKAGMEAASLITTVSPTYADEIRVLRLAWTIADLAGDTSPNAAQLGQALYLRRAMSN